MPRLLPLLLLLAACCWCCCCSGGSSSSSSSSSRWQPACPAEQPCRCTDLRLKCVQVVTRSSPAHYLSEIPYLRPLDGAADWSFGFHELRVRNQAMTNLTLRYPWGQLRVKKVEVTRSLVRRLQPNAFSGLAGVRSLNLSFNLLSSLSADDLRDLRDLQELVVHNNFIAVLHPGTFSLSSGIQKLYLSHNRLTRVPPEIRRLQALSHLYLQYNSIQEIPDFAFHGLRQLIILDLGSLKARLSIRPRAFCGLAGDAENGDGGDGGSSFLSLRSRGLVALYLRQNILAGLDLCSIGKLSSLRGLNLTGSFFPCSCHSAALLHRGAWHRTFGFSPSFVTYEPWLLRDCGRRLPVSCRISCSKDDGDCSHAPAPAIWEAEASAGNGAGDGDGDSSSSGSSLPTICT